MKILQVVTLYHPSVDDGGPAQGTRSQSLGLQALGHDVTIATSDFVSTRPLERYVPGSADDGGLTVLRFESVMHPLGRLASAAGMSLFPYVHSPAAERWFRANVRDFDVVFVDLAREYFVIRAASIALAQHRRLFVQPHGMLARHNLLHRAFDWAAVTRIVERSDAVFSLQEHEDGEVRIVAPGAHVHRLENGVPFAGLPAWAASEPATVLFVGRLQARKRVVDLILGDRAAWPARTHGSPARCWPGRWRPQGSGTTGGESGVAVRVDFTGAMLHDAVMRELARASLYVLPSTDEPFPRAVREALAVGTPSIVTSGCFIAPLLALDRRGTRVEPAPGAIADAIAELVRDPSAAGRLSENGRRLVTSRLNQDAVNRRLGALLARQHTRRQHPPRGAAQGR